MHVMNRMLNFVCVFTTLKELDTELMGVNELSSQSAEDTGEAILIKESSSPAKNVDACSRVDQCVEPLYIQDHRAHLGCCIAVRATVDSLETSKESPSSDVEKGKK